MFSRSSLVGIAICVGFCRQAAAICSPGVAHFIDVGTGPKCNTTDIQTAINSIACPDTTIRISTANGETYTSQHVALNNLSTAIVGSTEQCKSPPVVCDPDLGCNGGPPAKVAIVGDGANPVFYVNGGGAVVFANLAISGGKGADNALTGGGGVGVFGGATHVTLRNIELSGNSGGYGGGVAFYGDGSLTLDGAHIHDNTANSSGGGVSAGSSYVGHVELVLLDDPFMPTQIAFNHARNSGGGISVSGSTHLRAIAAVEGRIGIHHNSVGSTTLIGDGGGIFLNGTTFADIALPGVGIYNNHAFGFGGGIFVGPSSSGNPVLRLFSTDANSPTNLFGNTAEYSGGGLFVNPGNASVHATACLFDAAISGNTARQYGSAVYVAGNGRLFINPEGNAECDFAAVAALGAVRSAAGMRIDNNFSLAANNATTDAAAIDISDAGAQVQAQRLRVLFNNGGYAIRATNAAGSSIAFSQCLLDDNLSLHELVSLQGAAATFDGCTFADNTLGASQVFAFDSGMILTRSIVAEASNLPAWDPDAASGLSAQYLLLSGPKIPTDSTVVYADPAFVDRNNGNYQLQAASPAVDFAPAGNEAGFFDLGGSAREADLPGVPDRFGPRDLGAYEYPLPDRIFKNGFDIPG